MQDSTATSTHLTWQDSAYFDTTPPLEILEPRLPSLFHEHLLQPSDRNLSPVLHEDGNQWAFPILLFCLVMLTFAQRANGLQPITVLRAAFDHRQVNSILRYGQSSEVAGYRLMLMAAFMSITFFVTLLTGAEMEDGQNGLNSLPTIAGVVLALALGSRVTSEVLGILFNVPHLVREAVLNHNILFITCGMLLLPLSAFWSLGPSDVHDVIPYIGGAIIVLLYLKDLQRSLTQLWEDPNVKPEHIFYYFCALKLLPLFVFVRVVTS